MMQGALAAYAQVRFTNAINGPKEEAAEAFEKKILPLHSCLGGGNSNIFFSPLTLGE